MESIKENLLGEANVSKGQTIKVTVEKLCGGYISNAEGKRKIYKETEDIIEAIGFEGILDNIENDEYHIDIQLIPKHEYQDYMDLVDLRSNYKAEELSLQNAKDSGLIEEAEKFNPLPKIVEPDLSAPIKITAANAYSITRLKSINWQQLHDELPMLPSEITAITGMNTTTLYASLPKSRKGEFSFQNVQTRIGFTVLAQYYERTLGVRSSTKDQCEKMKEDMLKLIREIELIGNNQKFIKTGEVQKRLITMRTMLL